MLPYTVIAPFDNLIELADVSDVDSFRTFTSDGEHLDDLRFDFAAPTMAKNPTFDPVLSVHDRHRTTAWGERGMRQTRLAFSAFIAYVACLLHLFGWVTERCIHGCVALAEMNVTLTFFWNIGSSLGFKFQFAITILFSYSYFSLY